MSSSSLPWQQIVHVAPDYSIPATFDPNRIQGVFRVDHVVASGSAWLVVHWESRDWCDAASGALRNALGLPAPVVGGALSTASGALVSSRSPSRKWFEWIVHPGTWLLPLVAVIGALEVLKSRHVWLFGAPSAHATPIAEMRERDVLANSETTISYSVQNCSPDPDNFLTVEFPEEDAVRVSRLGDRAPVDTKFAIMGPRSVRLRSGESREVSFVGRIRDEESCRLQLVGEADSGLWRSGVALDSEIAAATIHVWNRGLVVSDDSRGRSFNNRTCYELDREFSCGEGTLGPVMMVSRVTDPAVSMLSGRIEPNIGSFTTDGARTGFIKLEKLARFSKFRVVIVLQVEQPRTLEEWKALAAKVEVKKSG